MLSRRDGPCAICNKTKLPVLEASSVSEASKGGYILSDFNESGASKVVIIATGSEVSLALDSVSSLQSKVMMFE